MDEATHAPQPHVSDDGTRRGLLKGTAAGLGGFAAASLLQSERALASAGAGEFNVKEAPYNAAGNGTTDDTSAIQSAINDAAGGGVVFFPRGTYKITNTLTLGNHVTMAGVSRTGATIRYSAGSTDTMLNASFKVGVTVQDLGIDANSQTGMKYGVYHAENSFDDKFLRVLRCRFKDFRHADSRTVYAWRAASVWIEGCEFQDCVSPVFMDESDHDVYVIGNKLWSPAGVTVNGVQISSSSAGNRAVAIIGNTIEDVLVDQSGNGIDGHGIRLYNSAGVRVEGNTMRNCQTSGILVGGDSFGSMVVGNACIDNVDVGIYVELTPSGDTSVGSGATRGASVIGNVCASNSNGIAVSYSAATVVDGNIVHSNDGDGIVCDSDRCTISNNVVYNNYRTAGNPPQLVKSGIRNYGTRGIHDGNVCYDSHSPKKQAYGIAVTDGNHIVTSNQVGGNLTGGVFTSGASNIVANNKNA